MSPPSGISFDDTRLIGRLSMLLKARSGNAIRKRTGFDMKLIGWLQQ
jgi:hypothetical protein